MQSDKARETVEKVKTLINPNSTQQDYNLQDYWHFKSYDKNTQCYNRFFINKESQSEFTLFDKDNNIIKVYWENEELNFETSMPKKTLPLLIHNLHLNLTDRNNDKIIIHKGEEEIVEDSLKSLKAMKCLAHQTSLNSSNYSNISSKIDTFNTKKVQPYLNSLRPRVRFADTPDKKKICANFYAEKSERELEYLQNMSTLKNRSAYLRFFKTLDPVTSDSKEDNTESKIDYLLDRKIAHLTKGINNISH